MTIPPAFCLGMNYGTKKLTILILLLGVSISGAFGQQNPEPEEKEPSVTVTEGKIEQQRKDSELRVVLDLMVSNRGRVYFAYNSASISAEAKKTLELLSEYLAQHPGLKVELEGQSDNFGKEKGNCALAVERAESVGGFLSDHGVSPNRMRTYGSCGPFEGEIRPDGANPKLRYVEFSLR